MRKFLILSLFCGSSLMASETLLEQDGSSQHSTRIVWFPQAPLKPNSSTYQYWAERAVLDPLVEIRGNNVWVGKEVRVRRHKEKIEG